MKIALNAKAGRFDLLALALDQMKFIADGLWIKKKYLAAREETLNEDHAVSKAVCEATARSVRDAVDQYLKTL